MLIEVSEREAQSLYFDRYWDTLPWLQRNMPSLIFGMAIAAGLFFLFLVNDWLGVGVCIGLISPGIYLFIKQMRNARRYAENQIKETTG